MADTVDQATRSRMMARIRGKDTMPERVVRRVLHRAGLRFVLHDRRLPGAPDIVLPKYRTCVLVHGCYWHRHAGCRLATNPATRSDFWQAKFRANTERDRRDTDELLRRGWRVIVVWECGIGRELSGEALAWLPNEIRMGEMPWVEWPTPQRLVGDQ